MSYSFSLRAASKALMLAAIAEKLTEIVGQQPAHAADREQAEAAASAFVNLLPEDASRDVTVTMSGWVTTASVPVAEGEPPAPSHVTSANVAVSAYLATRESTEG